MMSINVDRVEIFLNIGTVMVVSGHFIVVIPGAVTQTKGAASSEFGTYRLCEQ